MEESTEQDIQNPEKDQIETDESVTVAVEAEIAHDVDKTLYDAEEFLSNFAGLREENEQLKQANRELENQLEKARQELQEIQLEKQNIESQLIAERENNKTTIWKLRSEFQKVQEERLQWKEKYLDACMRQPQQPTDLPEGTSKSKKRKVDESTDILMNVGNGDASSPPEVILTLVSEDSKPYKLSLRECQYCGIGFCSLIALNHHFLRCEKRLEKEKLSETSVDCIECNVRFPTHADLVQHNQYHEGTHRFLCRICNRSYQSNPGRLKHEQLEHGSMPLLSCVACNKQFKRKDRLKDHIATKHSLETPHECQYCGMKFKLRDYLRKHCNQFHPGKPINSIATTVKNEPLIKSNDLSATTNITEENATSVTLLTPITVKSPTTSSDTTTTTAVVSDHSPDIMEITSSGVKAEEDEETISIAKLITTAEGQNKIVQVVVPAIPED